MSDARTSRTLARMTSRPPHLRSHDHIIQKITSGGRGRYVWADHAGVLKYVYALKTHKVVGYWEWQERRWRTNGFIR
jgi:hypothetical protein